MTTTEIGIYVTAVTVDEVFADPTYQRTLDVGRARHIAATWDRRLAGILEVSDRGEDHKPRFAVLDGQHRWAAAKYLKAPPQLVANVHSGLTIADEAALFDKLNRQRKQITTWDHWRARRAAGDKAVKAIEKTAANHNLRVHDQPNKDGVITCVSTLEKIANVSAGGLELLDATLNLLHHAWGLERDAYDAPLVGGMASLIFTLGDRVDGTQLVDALAAVPPKRVRFQGSALRDSTPGSLAKLCAIVMLNLYNKRPGPRLTFPSRWTGALPKAKDAVRV